MVSTYITASQMQRAVTGLPITSLIGVIGHVANAVQAGDATIQLGVGNETLDTTLDIGSQITVFDGAYSEQLVCTGPINSITSTVPIQPSQYSHIIGVEYCTDGDGGSLADVLVRASAKLESYCRQSLLLQTYTDIQHKRWSNRDIGRDGGLKILPTYWPVQSVISWSLTYDSVLTSAFPVDATTLLINSSTSAVLLPYISLVQSLILYGDDDIGIGSMSTFGNGRGFMSTLTYQSGYAMKALPSDIEDAAILYASIELVRSMNPTEAVLTMMGRQRIQYKSGSDQSGIPALQRQAENLLQQYVKSSHVR